MAERDMTPVSITLDRKRPYHIGDDERNVVWVGPGPCQVPRWVAEHWGAIPAPDQSAPEVPPAIPPGAVSATIETVDEQPMQTTETVEIVAPAVPRRAQRAPDRKKVG